MLRVVVVGRTHSRSVSLAMLTRRKELHGLISVSTHACYHVAPLGRPSGRRSSGVTTLLAFGAYQELLALI